MTRGVPTSETTSFRCPAELTIVTADDVKEQLLALMTGPLDIDASDLRVIDTAGLQVFVSAALAWRRRGHELAISQASRALADAVQVSGLSGLLKLPDPMGST